MMSSSKSSTDDLGGCLVQCTGFLFSASSIVLLVIVMMYVLGEINAPVWTYVCYIVGLIAASIGAMFRGIANAFFND
jgi:hypothetical protein